MGRLVQFAPGNTEAKSASLQPLPRASVRGKFFFAGDEKFLVKGVSYGAFRPDELRREYQDLAGIERDFEMMAASGINTVRIPHTIPPRSLLDAAQRHGLRVVVGLAAEQYVGFLIDGRKTIADIARLVREKVRGVAGHPALLCYALGNEIPAPVARWLGSKRIELYLKRLYRAVKSEDPLSIVSYVNYPSTEYLQLPFLDVVSFNVYLESEERFRAYLARLQNIAGDRPLLMSEIGLDALRNGEEHQARVLDWQIRASYAAGCAGVVVFSWTDEWHRAGAEVEDWSFGITNRERRPKLALDVVRHAFQQVPFPDSGPWPRISVIICTYNGGATLRESLGAVCQLTYPNFDVIVVNDGSIDETASLAAEYDCRLVTTENCGLSHARNVGMEAATGELVAYLDDDAMPDRHWLQYLADAFRRTSHAAIGGPNIAPPEIPDTAKCIDNAPGGPVHVLLDDETAEHLPGCNLAVRKSCLLEIGGFNPAFRVAGDDVDFCWRLQERGWTLGFAPGAMVWHHPRRTVSGYLRQQKGYGKAEGLLEEKWPEKFNAAGHHTFGGRVYGHGIVHALFRRCVIYHGQGGFAPFQSLYERAPGLLATLPLMPEWYLLLGIAAVIAALGLVWPPLLIAAPVLLCGIALSIAHAIEGGLEASFGTTPLSTWQSARMRSLTAILYLFQPLARLCGRLGAGLTAWRRRGAPGFAFPRKVSSAIWTNDWQEPPRRLEAIAASLREAQNVVREGSQYARWDLEVLGGMFGSARMLMAVEDHSAGAQYIRARITPRWGNTTRAMLLLLGLLTVSAALSHQAVIATIFGLLSFLLAVSAFRQAGQATAALLRVLQQSQNTPRAS
jgi:type IV secretory pathway TrbD component